MVERLSILPGGAALALPGDTGFHGPDGWGDREVHETPGTQIVVTTEISRDGTPITIYRLSETAIPLPPGQPDAIEAQLTNAIASFADKYRELGITQKEVFFWVRNVAVFVLFYLAVNEAGSCVPRSAKETPPEAPPAPTQPFTPPEPGDQPPLVGEAAVWTVHFRETVDGNVCADSNMQGGARGEGFAFNLALRADYRECSRNQRNETGAEVIAQNPGGVPCTVELRAPDPNQLSQGEVSAAQVYATAFAGCTVENNLVMNAGGLDGEEEGADEALEPGITANDTVYNYVEANIGQGGNVEVRVGQIFGGSWYWTQYREEGSNQGYIFPPEFFIKAPTNGLVWGADTQDGFPQPGRFLSGSPDPIVINNKAEAAERGFTMKHRDDVTGEVTPPPTLTPKGQSNTGTNGGTAAQVEVTPISPNPKPAPTPEATVELDPVDHTLSWEDEEINSNQNAKQNEIVLQPGQRVYASNVWLDIQLEGDRFRRYFVGPGLVVTLPVQAEVNTTRHPDASVTILGERIEIHSPEDTDIPPNWQVWWYGQPPAGSHEPETDTRTVPARVFSSNELWRTGAYGPLRQLYDSGVLRQPDYIAFKPQAATNTAS